MAIRKRTSKSVAKRHDLDYFKKGSPIRLWQWRLAALLLLVAAAWITFSASRSANAFSAGPISAPHSVFAQKCEVCHVPVVRGAGWMPVLGDRRKVPDSACIACHAVGPHHAQVAGDSKPCSSCHLEHIGAMHLAQAPVRGCTQCHADLRTFGASPTVATHINSFVQGHPDFRPLRNASAEVRDAAFGLKFDHAAHLQKSLSAPGGRTASLQCGSCHTVADVNSHGNAQSGRMIPVDFERSCRSCHTLDFSERVAAQAPHADSATVLRFVQEKMTLAAPRDEVALIKAEAILFRGKCSLCHTVAGADALPRVATASFEAPAIAPARQPERFFSASTFSHSAHGAVQCAECHAAALGSHSGKDVLLPGIAVCKRCHDGASNPEGALASGHAESGCALCHFYHEGGRMHGAAEAPSFRIDDLVTRH